MGPWDIAGPIIGLWGAVQQKKARRRYADQIAQAGMDEANAITSANKPLAETLDFALPMLRSAGVNLFGANVGKESPLIRGQFEESKKGLQAEKERALGESKQYWLGQGNTGRGRGEALRIGARTTEAENRLNLESAEAQEGFKEKNANRYVGWLGSMADFGKSSVSNLIDAARTRFGGQREAAGVRAGASSQFASDVSGVAGDIWGQQQAKGERRWLEDMYRKLKLFKE